MQIIMKGPRADFVMAIELIFQTQTCDEASCRVEMRQAFMRQASDEERASERRLSRDSEGSESRLVDAWLGGGRMHKWRIALLFLSANPGDLHY